MKQEKKPRERKPSTPAAAPLPVTAPPPVTERRRSSKPIPPSPAPVAAPAPATPTPAPKKEPPKSTAKRGPDGKKVPSLKTHPKKAKELDEDDPRMTREMTYGFIRFYQSFET